MCDDDKNPMSALEQEIINLMYATFERPFRDTEFEFDNNYTLNNILWMFKNLMVKQILLTIILLTIIIARY